jgi:2-C-methyl-D-erythritol 4-phosphate cytidylyltransferase
MVAVVPAAGLGKRFGQGTNKPFQTLGGKPLVVWSISELEKVSEIVEIIPVLKSADMAIGQKLFDEYAFSKIKKIAPGGKERQDSVYNGLRLIDDEDCMVLIHDGVRPLVGKELIENIIKELQSDLSPSGMKDKAGFEAIDGVIPGVPLKDTVKEAENGMVRKTLKRGSLWAVQTPQVFHYASVLHAYEKALNEGYFATDDAALVERYGGRVKIIMGSYRNIKITTPEDLEIAEYLLGKSPEDKVCG